MVLLANVTIMSTVSLLAEAPPVTPLKAAVTVRVPVVGERHGEGCGAGFRPASTGTVTGSSESHRRS